MLANFGKEAWLALNNNFVVTNKHIVSVKVHMMSCIIVLGNLGQNLCSVEDGLRKDDKDQCYTVTWSRQLAERKLGIGDWNGKLGSWTGNREGVTDREQVIGWSIVAR